MDNFSLADIRKKNYADVYRYIYRQRRVSKQDIAGALRMSLPTVTQHLAALTKDGLISRQGQMASSIGRKAAAYEAIAQARLAVGAEILRDRVTVVLLDLYGEVFGRIAAELPFEQTDAYFCALASLTQELLASCGAEPKQVLGAGLGLQSLVSEDGQRVLYGQILHCTGMTADRLGQLLPFPCRFVHDAECAAALELWRTPSLTDALYLSLGQHLGGAIIMDGGIKSGRTGRTGAFEHMTLSEGGKLCYCGKRGCMECYCSAGALLDGAGSLEEFFTALHRGDAAVQARWERYLDYLALAINNLHMVLDSPVLLGGHVAPFLTEQDLDALFARIQRRTAFPESENFLRVGAQEPDVVALGAAIPFVRDFLAGL
ncbi:ROK family transcriptional regulator [Anaerofilum sp. BX8]|uniref:ROK family transcriptional regulator n=1 Tax=Anaerofilum hominis TaxID=2763016 RepID=A0A923IDX4_9FIRM|nr:ROK family transcriptional regulator [Anaerofilum hominis]MBC5580652.1 ROK family transcriptional regulator [Anaerofilum hominis]